MLHDDPLPTLTRNSRPLEADVRHTGIMVRFDSGTTIGHAMELDPGTVR